MASINKLLDFIDSFGADKAVLGNDSVWIVNAKGKSVRVKKDKAVLKALSKLKLYTNNSKRESNIPLMPVTEQAELQLYSKPVVTNLDSLDKLIKVKPSKVRVLETPKKVKKQTAKQKGRKVFTPSELTDAPVNDVITSFLAKYYSNTGNLGGLPLDKAWKEYSKIKVPAKFVNARTFKQIRLINDSLKNAKPGSSMARLKEEILQGNVKRKVMKADRSFKGDFGDITTQVAQVALEITNSKGEKKTVLFSDKYVSSTRGTLLGKTLRDYYNQKDPVAVVTPDSVHNITYGKDGISFDGKHFAARALKSIDQEAVASNYVDARAHGTNRVSIKQVEQEYAKVQAKMEPSARIAMSQVVKQLSSEMTLPEFNDFIATHKVKDIKRLTNNLHSTSLNKISRQALKEYTFKDDVSLEKFLGYTKPNNKEYQELKDQFKERVSKAEVKITNDALQNVLLKAHKLDIPSSAIMHDLQTLGGGKKDSKKTLEVLDKMDNTFSYTLADNARAKAARILQGKRKQEIPNYREIVKLLHSDNAVSELEAKRVLSPGIDNPLTNLEGRIQHKHVEGLAEAMIKDVMSGRPGTYNQEALVQLGQLLSSDDLKRLPDIFKKTIKAKANLMGGRHQGIKEVLNRFNLAEDNIIEPLQGRFGSKDQQAETKAKIIQGKDKTATKEYEKAVEAFAQGDHSPEYVDLEYNSKISEFEKMRNEKAAEAARFNELSKKDRKGLVDPNEDLKVIEEELANLKAVNSKGVFAEDIDLSTLEKKLSKWRRLTGEKPLDYGEYKEMLQLSKSLGFNPKKAVPTPKELHGFLSRYLERKLNLSDVAGSRKRVQVNLTKPLYMDLVRGKNRDVFHRLGAHKLPGLVRYTKKNKAEYASIMAHKYGDAGRYGLVFQDPKKVLEKRNFILNKLASFVGDNEFAIPKKDFARLTAAYKRAHKSSMTLADEQAYKTINRHLVKHPKTGEKLIGPDVDVKTLFNELLKPYSATGFETKPGDPIYVGKKAYEDPTKTFKSTFDHLTGKVNQKAGLTKYRRAEAINAIEARGLTKQFQAKGVNRAKTADEFFNLIFNTDNSLKSFINKHLGVLAGQDAPILDHTYSKAKAELNKFGNLAYEAYEAGDYQTYNAHTKAIENLKRSLDTKKYTKTSVKLAQNLLDTPDKALGSRLAGKARTGITEQAVKFVEFLDAKNQKNTLPTSGIAYGETTMRASTIKAEALKDRLLGLIELGYKKETAPISEYVSNKGFSSNTDPLLAAEKKGVAKVAEFDRFREKNRAKLANLRNSLIAKNINMIDPKLVEELKPLGSILSKSSFKEYKSWLIDWKEFKKPKHYNIHRPMRLATGGKIPGDGVKDEVPALLMKGETVLDKGTSKKLGIHTEADYKRFKKAVKQGRVKFYSDGDVVDPLDPYRYKYRPHSPASGLTALEYGLQERARVAKNITIDLANADVHMNFGDKSLDELGKAINDTRGSLPKSTIAAAEQGLMKRALHTAGLKGLGSTDIDLLKQVGSGYSTLAPKDLTPKLVKTLQDLASTDFDTFNKSMQTLNSLKGGDYKDIARGIKKTVNYKGHDLSADSEVGLSKFQRAAIHIENYAGTLGQIFDLDSKHFKGLENLTAEQVSTQIKGALKKVDFNKVKLPTSSLSIPELQGKESALQALENMLGDVSFIKHDDYKLGVKSTRSRVSKAIALKESAEGRVSNFGALMKQNAAFMGSYAVLGGVQALMGSTIGFFSNFDDALKNLQAITGDTTEGLGVMSNAVKSVSTNTKFGAIEISQAATVLGQAGFSATDISKSLDGVVELATATGSKLEDATQVLTSTLTIWDKSISSSRKIANQFTAAINESKLDIEGLAGAIQYTGNIAAAAHIPIADVVTATSLLKDAGIKRSSTLGTGQRLLYADLSTPSKRFAESLKASGISLEKFSKAFNDRGVLGALKLMKEAGYGLSQAAHGMEVREKATYLALTNQLDKFDVFRTNITGTNAAAVANSTQMEGIGNKFKNMINSWQIDFNESFNMDKPGIRKLLDAMTVKVKTPKPSENTGVKGYTLEDRYIQTSEGSPKTALALGALGLGYGGYKWGVPAYQGNLAAIKGKLAAGVGTGLTNSTLLTKVERAVLGFDKILSSKAFSALAGGAGVLALGAANAATAEDNKFNAFMAPVTFAGAMYAGNKAVGGVANGLKSIGKEKYAPKGNVAKFGYGMLLNYLDSSLVQPMVDKGSAGGVIARAVEGAVLGGIAAPGNPWAKVAGAVAGGVTAIFSKIEPPKIDATKAFSSIATDAKALSSELGSMADIANTLSDRTSFALRPGADAGPAEKISKFRAVVGTGLDLNKNLSGVEASLVSNAATFKGFGIGEQLARTSVSDILANRFMVKKFTADGTDIKVENIVFNGTAADALAESVRSAEKASRLAMTAPGGVNDNMFNQLKSRDLEKFKSSLDELKGFDSEFKIALSKRGTNPIFSLLREAPGISAGNLGDIRKQLTTVLDTAGESIKDKIGVFNLGWTKDVQNFKLYRDSTMAKFESYIETLGNNAKTPEQAIAVARGQVKDLANRKGITLQAAFDEYITSKAGRNTSEVYKNLSQQDSAISKFTDQLSAGIARLDTVDTVGIKLIRQLSQSGAKTLRGGVTKFGSEMMLATLEPAMDLAAAFKDVEKILRTGLVKGGVDLKGMPNTEALKNYPGLSITNRDLIGKYASGDKSISEEDLVVNTKGLVSINNLSNKAIKLELRGAAKGILKSYLGALEKGAKLFDNFNKIQTRDEAIATGDIAQVKMFDAITTAITKIGFRDRAAYETLKQRGPGNIASLNPDDILSDKVLRGFEQKRSNAIQLMELQKEQAKNNLIKKESLQEEQVLLKASQAYDKIQLQRTRQEERVRLGTHRQFLHLATQVNNTIDATLKSYEQQKEGMQRVYQRNIAHIELQRQRGYEDLKIRRQRGQEDIAISGVRGREDIFKSFVRNQQQLELNRTRALEDLATNFARGMEDLQKKSSRGYEDIATWKSRATQDLNTSQSRGIEDIGLRKTRGQEDIAQAFTRGLNDIGLRKQRGTEDIQLKQARMIEDLSRRIARAKENALLGQDRAGEQLRLRRDRAIQDAYTHFQDSISAIHRGFQRTMAAISRSRQDAINAFERSLNKPQTITLNPKALGTIANQLGDVGLALDAHKAALTANTTAVMQNNRLQQSQEDLAKSAYTEAYKKTGGKVYNEDGTVNEDFSKAYNTYLDKNSGGLIDSVLNNALSKAFGGMGFDITKALGDVSYLAGAVSNPTAGMTTAGAVAGTGMTDDQLAGALFGVKADEVRITTTTGVILEAQGGMQGALYDLGSTMISFDIKIREAGFSMRASIEEAGINLSNSLRDINTAYSRGLQDLTDNFAKTLEDLERAQRQGMEDIDLAIKRAYENLDISIQRAGEDLRTRINRATEDLVKGVARATEDLETKIRRAGEDIETRAARMAEDLETRISRATEDLQTALQRGAEDVQTKFNRASEDLKTKMAEATEDLATKLMRAAEDLDKAINRGGEDVDRSADRGIEDAGIAFKASMDEAAINLTQALDRIATNAEQQGEAFEQRKRELLEDIALNYKQQLADLDSSVEVTISNFKMGLEEAIAALDASQSDKLALLDAQILQMKEGTLISLSDWVKSLEDSIKTQFNNTAWDATQLQASLQTAIDTSLQQLHVDGSVITKQVAISFKTAFQAVGEQLKGDVASILKESFSHLDQPVKTTMSKLSTALDTAFKETLGKSFGEQVKVINTAATNLKGSVNKFTAGVSAVDVQVKLLGTAGDKLKEATSTTGPYGASVINVNTLSTNMKVAGDNLKGSTDRLNGAVEPLGIFAGTLSGVTPLLIAAGEQSSEAGGKILEGAGVLSAGIASTYGVAGAIAGLGPAFQGAASQAMGSIQAAVQMVQQAAQQAVDNMPTSGGGNTDGHGHSLGGFIPGYGGGDIVPSMLEPGEFIVRKEIVKALGVDKLEAINRGDFAKAEVNSTRANTRVASGPGVNVQIGVAVDSSMDTIENNIELIADGVKRVFEEYQ